MSGNIYLLFLEDFLRLFFLVTSSLSFCMLSTSQMSELWTGLLIVLLFLIQFTRVFFFFFCDSSLALFSNSYVDFVLYVG